MATIKIATIRLADDGIFPNNELPVLHYKSVLNVPKILPGYRTKLLFKSNGWYNSWESGIFTFHHYHSNTHEVLGIIKGKTTLQVGGEHGKKINIEKGDVIIIPAGVAHKNLGDEYAITCIGAYPDGKDYDMNYGLPDERPEADNNIKTLPISAKDPVFDQKNGLSKYWENQDNSSATEDNSSDKKIASKKSPKSPARTGTKRKKHPVK